MKLRSVIAVSCLITSAAFAADLPRIPSKPIAEKKKLLFEDDFEGKNRPKEWHKVVDTFAFENGTLKGSQTRTENKPAGPDGKGEVRAHAAVHGLTVPTKDSVIEVKIKFEGAALIDVEFDDREYKGSHYGHLSRAQIRLDSVTIVDERDGSQNEALKAMKADPAKKDEANKAIAAHQVKFPVKLEASKWYTLGVETVGDEMRVTIDGKGVAFFKSPGIGHETKSKIELGVSGKDGFYDDIKVWDAAAVK